MPRWLLILALPFATLLALGQPPSNPEADRAAQRARVEKGLTVELWASEPLIANPVAFAFDEKGRCFVAETNRFKTGVPDTRDHMRWLDEDIGARTIADRLAMYRKHRYEGFEKYDDQIRLVWDSTGKGKADKSTVFSKGYNRPEDGLAAGVLARKGDVYFTNIPDLYRLRDKDNDGVADEKESFATGFGVRAQFLGHDLHGLILGPDGKLYFSIGDRGLNVTTKDGKKLYNPDSGAVLRCDPDGSNMEIVHVGLRNPQELVFDDLGNLFTYDNNSDSGDRARWVQIVEGGESGWRCGYQYGTYMHHDGVPQGNRGPWNTEKIWHVPGPDGGPPAYVVPPLLHFGNGPAGLTFYPGVGLPDRYKGHFFACDFTSSPNNSAIWSLAVKPKGASFEITDLHKFVEQMVPTDCDFGPDGAFYWSDWVGGWDPPQKGRIFRLTDAEAMKNPAVAEARKLLAEGFEKKENHELLLLFEHPHRKVRQEAQFELARRLGGRPPGSGTAYLDSVADYAVTTSSKMGKLHAIWFCGMVDQRESFDANASSIERRKESVIGPIVRLLRDADPDVRSQAAKTYGTLWQVDPDPLLPLFADPDPRVRSLVAESFGKLAKPGDDGAGYKPLLALLKSNQDADPYVRHAAVQALARMTLQPCQLLDAFEKNKETFDTPAVRLGVVLALRKLQCRRLGEFLADSDPRVAAEAARAIYDQELMTPMEDLAKAAETPNLPEPVAYRAIAANYKLGGADHAARVAEFAARSNEPDHLRQFALKLLADWPNPPRRDPITGLTQELEERPVADVVTAIRPLMQKLFSGSEAVRGEAVRVTAKLGIPDVGPLMAGIVRDEKQTATARVEALFALEAVKAKELTEAVRIARDSTEPRLRGASRVVSARANPKAAMIELPKLLEDDSTSLIEKQLALGVTGTLRESKEIDTALADLLDEYLAGKLPDALKLDVLEAAQARASARRLRLHAPLREKLKAIDARSREAEKTDPLAHGREALVGGDTEKGRQIFINNAAVYCQRCHKLDGQGGDVGPNMNGIGAKQTREYLLESILLPSAKIAEGYNSVILNTLDGLTISGVLRSKDEKGYTIITADNKVIVIPMDDVDSEKPDKSAMPDDLHKKLTKRELRDVIEFLSSLKDEPKK